MNRSRVLLVLFLLALTVAGMTRTVWSQEEDSSSKQNQPAENKAAQRPLAAYRLEFTLTEFEDGKKTNSRSYSLLAQTHSWNKLRIGTRLPVATATSATMPVQFQYMDIGMNIDANVEEQEGLVLLNSTVDVSGMAPQREEQTHQPIIRQMKSELRTVVSPGKPTVITADDDPTGKARFQLEVTATKVK